MIRHDYIIEQIEEFGAILRKIPGFAQRKEFMPAHAAAQTELQQLTGVDLEKVLALSESELFARIAEGEPPRLVEPKIFMVAAILKAAADLKMAEGAEAKARDCYLKGLHLLLGGLERTSPDDRPEFVPSIESFVLALGDEPLPSVTTAMLMRHHEQIGEFDKAENDLFRLIESEKKNPALRELGEGFYERLLRESDADLAAGHLTREEVKSGLVDFRAKLAA